MVVTLIIVWDTTVLSASVDTTCPTADVTVSTLFWVSVEVTRDVNTLDKTPSVIVMVVKVLETSIEVDVVSKLTVFVPLITEDVIDLISVTVTTETTVGSKRS